MDRSLESAYAREFFEEGGWPNDQWWEMFGDPQLNVIVERALEQNPTIQRAIALVAEAEQEARKERAALFPRLDFEYTETWQYFSKNGLYRSFYPTPPNSPPIRATDNQVDLSLYFNYEIDFFGRNRNLFRAALGRARAERAEARQATLMITTLVVQTYIELQTKLALFEVLKARQNLRNSLFELTASRSLQGLDSFLPILERESDIYRVEETLLDMDKEIALDRHMLGILVGASPDEDVAPAAMGALFEKPVMIPSDLSSDLLARRPDLTAQLWRIEAAAKDIGAARADFYPRVNLMAFAQLESLSFNKLLKISSRQGGLAPSVHLPIFTGGKLTANLRGKVAEFNRETYRYNELILNAAKEVADQITVLTSTFDTLSIQISALEVAEDQFFLQNSRHQQGISNALTVLEKENEVLSQQYALLASERNYLLAVLKMVKALGGGYHAHQIPGDR